MELILFPNDTLRIKCKTVTAFDAKLRNTLREMTTKMNEWGGIGLAAPQCGINTRMFVAKVPGHGVWSFVNPQLKILDATPSIYDEGCLSLPGEKSSVTRPSVVKVRAFNGFGKPFNLVCTDLLSVCVQHEYDHLDGILMTDRAQAGSPTL